MLLISFPEEKLFDEIQALLLFMVGTYKAKENHHLFRSFTDSAIRPFSLCNTGSHGVCSRCGWDRTRFLSAVVFIHLWTMK